MPSEPRSYANQRRALYSRPGVAATPEICIGDVRIELETLTVTVSGRTLDLTVQEFDLLVLLARDAGRPVAQSQLAAGLWRTPGPQHKRHISVLVARLRAKLAGSQHYHLETMRKRGYALAAATPTVPTR